jgi:hypothetical protein
MGALEVCCRPDPGSMVKFPGFWGSMVHSKVPAVHMDRPQFSIAESDWNEVYMKSHVLFPRSANAGIAFVRVSLSSLAADRQWNKNESD